VAAAVAVLSIASIVSVVAVAGPTRASAATRSSSAPLVRSAATRSSSAPLVRSGRAYCAVETRIGDLDLLASSRPSRVRADLTALLRLSRLAARVAPEVIRADAEASADAQAHFNAIYARHAWRPEPTNLDPEFVALSDSPELTGVYLRLEQYQRTVCRRSERSGPPVA